ncbi:hypothetical protein [Bradyrhizobium sp. WSM471]|uniref:hypothetical protein n=1 Tax=Bradyrhizobium sp. WSM471 TaxID=319017 RepID=UPI00024D2D98|nr:MULTISPECIES: hypothetical protein [Bradyrhizobium]EHR03223.1 hypothetical protein Bra471DRAFT_03992 [Bradyrhizobium sp. WSM471]UFW38451.1 hypothetical protein BcanWSM471_19590 [Bradyrhizobium canariense]
MSRQSRVESYQRMDGPKGAGRDEKNLDYWVDRATENSKIASRGSDGPMKLPSTKATVRETTMRPMEARKIDKLMKGEEPGDLNHTGSGPFMRSIRRKA